MESRNLIYKYGHFYDSVSKKRMTLVDGAEICIVALPGSFTDGPHVGPFPLKVLNQTEKEFEIRNEPDLVKHNRIYKKGSFLYFYISRSHGKENVTHEFKVELMEDLYLFLKKGWKQEKLYDCSCIVRENISGTIDFFEEIHAESLNEAYKNTFVHFFGNEGNPACNALDRFYDAPGSYDLKVGRHRKKQ